MQAGKRHHSGPGPGLQRSHCHTTIAGRRAVGVCKRPGEVLVLSSHLPPCLMAVQPIRNAAARHRSSVAAGPARPNYRDRRDELHAPLAHVLTSRQGWHEGRDPCRALRWMQCCPDKNALTRIASAMMGGDERCAGETGRAPLVPAPRPGALCNCSRFCCCLEQAVPRCARLVGFHSMARQRVEQGRPEWTRP